MYRASFKTKDGESFVGYMGSGVPSKKGFHSIKLEVTGGIAHIPDEEVKGAIDIGENVAIENITILAPEITKESVIIGKEKSGGGLYYKPTEVKPGSKLESVVNLMKANPGKSRKEYIDLVVAQVGMTPAGASTYISNAKPFV